MAYWHEIVKNYGAHDSDGSRGKDHGTITPKTSVILLIYLSFGTDYPSGIADYFSELRDGEIEMHCPRVFTNSNKISSVLKQMNEDKLVTDPKIVKGRAAPRSYYTLNPQVLESPMRDSITYTNHFGSPFEIPPETIEGFLKWLALMNGGTTDKRGEKQVRQERHECADEIFEGLFRSKEVDYASFLDFIRDKAERWDLSRKTSNQQSTLSDLISGYITEIDEGWDWENPLD